jgi:hypothetical protein
VKQNEAADPADVRFLGSDAVVSGAERDAHTLEEAWRRTGRCTGRADGAHVAI